MSSAEPRPLPGIRGQPAEDAEKVDSKCSGEEKKARTKTFGREYKPESPSEIYEKKKKLNTKK